MSCQEGRTKIWIAAGGSTFTQSARSPEGASFTAVARVFSGHNAPVDQPLPLKIALQANTHYFVVTRVMSATKEPIPVQLSSAIGDQTHCTTVSAANGAGPGVEHTISAR